jgi:hypothetical protein
MRFGRLSVGVGGSLLLAMAIGCGGKSSSTSESCVSGESIACAAVSGCTGAQVCLPGGSGYGPCQCPGNGSAGDAAASPDAATIQPLDASTSLLDATTPLLDATTEGEASTPKDGATADALIEAASTDAAACSVDGGIPGGSYLATCSDCAVSATALTCTCLTETSQPMASSLNLCACVQPFSITNENGTLACDPTDAGDGPDAACTPWPAGGFTFACGAGTATAPLQTCVGVGSNTPMAETTPSACATCKENYTCGCLEGAGSAVCAFSGGIVGCFPGADGGFTVECE